MAGRGNPNPISFKTVPNRNKTQKWSTAKTYNYDGDDWGGYDPYDEYSYDDPPVPSMPQQQQQQQPPPQQFAQSQGYGRPPPRKNSFDQGDERRNFSAGPVMYGAESRSSGSPARSNVSGGDYNDGPPRSRPRDFTNPEQVPPPLTMRGSPAPATFPPRKSSISSGSPAPEVAPMPATKKEEKELPIPPVIRPSDIYKRMEAEREKERQSMEGARPSMDSLLPDQDAAQQQARPLSSVQEDFGVPIDKSGRGRPPMLPSVRNMSGIGTSFLHSSSEADPPTRAPDGKDPAAEILAERTDTRAPPGADPASEILAERTVTRAQPGYDPAGEILAERTATRAQPGNDPAADIMAERGHEPSIPEPESGVEHHYRSMVDHAFDNDSAQNSASLSRDSSVYSQSVGGTGVSRNSSNSTAGISPIMSRVPSAATAKMQQLERERQVPTIAEEPSQRGTPVHSRNVSAGSNELYHPGYRRSLDPPSGDNSPARTPGLENAHSRRVSQPMSAETGNAEPPAVPDQGVEMMPGLEPGETPASELPTPAVPITGRSRAGTDYSMRESDIAREASTSPEKNEFSPSIAQAANAEQTAFLQDHASTPTSQWPPTASGRSSPGKGRVRDLAGKYQNIEAESRRGSTASSKSSWSNFHGSNEDLPGLKKRATGESGLGSELGPSTSETRPAMASQMSFRPGLPGQWVSYAVTPGETPATRAEEPTSREFGGSNLQSPQEEETPDFSPTTGKQQLSGHSPSSSQQAGFLTQAKDVGEAIGASLISKVGIGHQTRDFASTEPPAPVEQPRGYLPTGDMGQLNAPDRPELNRGDTEGSMATDIASSASSVPPTPPVKDGVGAQHGQAPRQRQLQEESRPISNYFSGAVAPLQPSKGHNRNASAGLDIPKLGPMTNMSTDTREGEMESDRLRREIVRSLSPTTSREDNAALTQDAIDAPDNMRKVEAGQAPEPAAEAIDRPGLGLLNQRFSWEERADPKGILDSSPAAARTRDMPTVREPSPDPEIRPEMPYERPRSRGLHIVNPAGDDSSDDDQVVQQTPRRMLDPEDKGIVSPFTPSQENLREGLDSRDISRDDMSAGAPSPMPGLEVVDSRDSDSDIRVPSYYIQGQPDNLNLPRSPSLTQQSPVPEPTSPTTPQTAIPDPSPTSPTAANTSAPAASSKPHGASTSAGKIPPFREILANKDTTKRMDLYKETRQTFADSHTGLADWLEGMLERNPEYAQLGTRLQPSATSLGVAGKSSAGVGHKHSPSLAKFKSLGSTFAGGGDGSTTGAGGGLRRSSTNREVSGGSTGAGGAPPLPPKDAVWEQRGKDLMKGASVFGGKAQAGAKGLLLKGRSRFGTKRESGSGAGGGGGEKALPPTPPAVPPTPNPTALVSPLQPAAASSTTSTTPPLPLSSASTPPPYPSTATPSPRLTSRATTGTDSLLVPSASTSTSDAQSTPSSRAASQAPSRAPSTLSRTWSRLRERTSQSQSQSQSRSHSRPASLAAPVRSATSTPSNANYGDSAGSVWGGGSELGVLRDASPVASTAVPAGTAMVVTTPVKGAAVAPWDEPPSSSEGSREPGDGKDVVVSPWDEPGDSVGKVVEGDVVPERLGVLPSPTATAFSTVAGDSPTKGGRSRQGSAVSGVDGVGVVGRRGSHVDEMIREDEMEGEVVAVEKEGEMGDLDVHEEIRGQEKERDVYEELQRGWGTDSEADAASADEREGNARPAYERGQSARAYLPSQMKSSSVPQSPTSPRSTRGVGEEEDELYESTPRQMHFPRRVGDEEDGEGRPVVTVGEERAFGEQFGSAQGHREARKSDEDVGALPPPPREDSAFDLAGFRDAGVNERSATATQDVTLPAEPEATSAGATGRKSPLAMEADPSTSSPAQDWDKRSAVSSRDNFHDANEGEETDYSTALHSRHSSVSSLGNAAAGEAMSAQAVPAGPVGTVHQGEGEMAETDQGQQGFMNRPYRSGAERPMSYFPLGTTATGAPVQESLDGMAGPDSPSMDLSGISGPPVGVLPYQKHPAMRAPEGGLPGDHGGLRSPSPAPDTNLIAAAASAVRPTPRSRQVSAETREKSSRRVSGLFRSRRPSQAAATTVYGPAPSAISDQYGLETLPTGPAAVARPGTQASGEANQAKRRSGIWNSFKRSSVILADDSRQSSIAALPPSQPNIAETPMQQLHGFQETRANTLKKPQRATTNATPPEPAKKKRFSGLGSLFGRSSTTGHKTERPRKLTKQPSSGREGSSTYVPGTSSVATGYEAFEEARRRQARENTKSKSPQIGLPQQERADLTTAAIDFPHGYQAPPGGWYAPDREAAAQQQQRQHRVLHSERERPDLPLGDVPEAFRPVDSSFGRPVAPVGPPTRSDEPMSRRMNSPPMSPVGPPSMAQRSYSGGYYSTPEGPPPQQRQMSYGSNEYQLSPQVSGQSEYQRQDWPHRGSSPSISPVHSRTGSDNFPPPRQVRVGSISEEIARGPPQQQGYINQQQQRPWAVSMQPPGSKGQPPVGMAYGGNDEYPPYHDYGYAQGPYAQPHMQMPMPNQRMPGPQHSQAPMQHAQSRYPSSLPYSPGPAPAPYQQSQPSYSYTTQPTTQHQRYYSLPAYNPGQQSQVPRQYSEGPPMQEQQRPMTSEYLGRRDDPALGEESLMEMRGASYPGQEWAPGRWD